jgi:hypothetical protein
VNPEVLSRINELIILNTDVKIAINDESIKYIAVGSPLEVGMIQFLVDNNISVVAGLGGRST